MTTPWRPNHRTMTAPSWAPLLMAAGGGGAAAIRAAAMPANARRQLELWRCRNLQLNYFAVYAPHSTDPFQTDVLEVGG